MQMNSCEINDLEVRYVEVEGPSPPIVFLHGATDSLTSYLASIRMLDGAARMLAMDFRGHGLSAHAAGAYRVRDHAADLETFLVEVVREPAVVAGHSLGALVATAVGQTAPAYVRGVFLEDPPFYTAQLPAFADTPDYQIFLGLQALLREHHAAGRSVDALAELVGAWPIHPMLFAGRSLLDVAGPEVVRARAESLHRMDLEVLRCMLDGSQFDGFDPEEALGAIAAPVHLLAGTVGLGGTIEPRDVEQLAALVRRYTHRIMPEVGHFIHHTAPSDYVDEVRTFASMCG